MTQSTNDMIFSSDAQLSAQGEPLSDHFIIDGDSELAVPESYREDENLRIQNEIIQNIQDYNATLDELDPMYSEDIEIPDDRLLVRVYWQDPVDEDGLFIGFGHIKVPMAGNSSDFKSVVNPHPYKNLGVVVQSASDKFNPGDKVQMFPSAIQLRPVPGTETVECPKMFRRYDVPFDEEQPLQHRGYLLIRPMEIECKIKKQGYLEA